MHTVLVVGESERAWETANLLSDAGYEVQLLSAADALSRLADGALLALVVDLPTAADVIEQMASPETNRVPSLGILPQEMLDSGGLAQEVDDFAVYPLRPHELKARLRRLIEGHVPIESPDVLWQGALAIDTAGYRVFVDNTLVELKFKEHELLRFLATHPDRVYTRQALLDKVWGYDYLGGARTVDVHIRRIRSKIEIGGHTFIETVRSVGYRFRPSAPIPSPRPLGSAHREIAEQEDGHANVPHQRRWIQRAHRFHRTRHADDTRSRWKPRAREEGFRHDHE